MTIDIASDTIMPLDLARVWLGERLGCAPSYVTLKRWIGPGVKGHRLESILVGGRRHTSVEAIDRFISALSRREPSPTVRRRREIEAASRRADALFGRAGRG